MCWVDVGVLHKLHLNRKLKNSFVEIWENKIYEYLGTNIFDFAKAIVAEIAVGYISDTFESVMCATWAAALTSNSYFGKYLRIGTYYETGMLINNIKWIVMQSKDYATKIYEIY